MATAARSSGIAKHLIDFCVMHIHVHGKNSESGRYIKSNIALWRDTYGDGTAAEVQKVMRKYWSDV